MIRENLVLYFVSRCLSAVGNLAAVAIFTRLAGPEMYGHYVVSFATALVITGFSAQWIRFAFFNHYRSDDDHAFFASFVTVIGASMFATTAVSMAVLLLNGADVGFVAGALLIGLSIALFEVITEVSRVRMQAGRTALSLVLRALLSLLFGVVALMLHRSALSLAAGIAIANIVATIPSAMALGRLLGGRPNWSDIGKLVTFGWPLMLSFGIGAFSLGVDRFMLAGLQGTAAVGAYGALSDFIKASFLVLAESATLATIPLAKRQFSSGDEAGAICTLEHAFKLLIVIATFVSAGSIVFAPAILPTLFPAEFLVGYESILPVIILGALLYVFRSMYFGQIIYFARASHLELLSSILLTAVNLALCLYLIPRYGVVGAAFSFAGGQLVAAVFLFWQGSRRFVMPIPLRPLLGMMLLGVLLVVVSRGVGMLHISMPATVIAEAGLFWAAIIGTALAFGLRLKDLHEVGGAVLARALAKSS